MNIQNNFRVVIAGGGVGGLTLASALEHAGVDYVLLERRGKIAPQVGASIGILPNGSRILDQLGSLDKLSERMQTVLWMSDRDNHGRLVCPESDVWKLGLARTGYELVWGDRQILLEILFENIKDKSKILLNKNVVKFEHQERGVILTCDDESSFEGNILVGADGVQSKTREELWKLAETANPSLVKQDKNCMFAEYRCLFGIASSVQGLENGDFDIGYNVGRSSITVASKNGKIYYFIFERLNAIYQIGNIPKYSQTEAKEFAIQHGDMHIRTGLKFSYLWEHTVSFQLVALEEANFKIWTFGCIACLGDSIHKMTPNIGAGGNAAIESAAALANQIKIMLDKQCDGVPSQGEIKQCLETYQRSRQMRVAYDINASGKVTRLQTMRGLRERVFFRVLLPRLGDFLLDIACDVYVGATMIQYLPPPKASLSGTMPFNPSQGGDRKESKLQRALVALPLFGLFYLAGTILDVDKPVPWFLRALEARNVSFDTSLVPLQLSFYNIKWLDNLWAPINVFFMPVVSGYDAVSRMQLVSFFTDYGIIIAIWAIESTRRANALTLSQIPALFTLLGQIRGIGVLGPLYYFFHYIGSPIENFKATDMRLTRVNYTRVILPTVLLAHYIPFYAMVFWRTSYIRQSWLFIWQMFPIWAAITAFILSHASPNTMMCDRIKSPKRDLPSIRFTVGTLIFVSACFWVWAWFPNPNGIAATFFPRALPAATPNLTAFSREFLRYDELFLFVATFIWLGYLFWDMKHAGMLQDTCLKIGVSAVSTTIALGPGAAVGLGWLWREEIITNKRHKAAITGHEGKN